MSFNVRNIQVLLAARTSGFENAPKAFIGLLNGQYFGKQLVNLI